MLIRRQGKSSNSRALLSGSTNLPAAQAARVGLVFGRVDTALARAISEEEPENASSVIWLLLQYIVLKLLILPQGCTFTAGTF